MAHFLEAIAQKAEQLQNTIKKKHSDNKALARQIIAGARENADYACDSDRWSMDWYVKYVRELENRAS